MVCGFKKPNPSQSWVNELKLERSGKKMGEGRVKSRNLEEN